MESSVYEAHKHYFVQFFEWTCKMLFDPRIAPPRAPFVTKHMNPLLDTGPDTWLYNVWNHGQKPDESNQRRAAPTEVGKDDWTTLMWSPCTGLENVCVWGGGRILHSVETFSFITCGHKWCKFGQQGELNRSLLKMQRSNGKNTEETRRHWRGGSGTWSLPQHEKVVEGWFNLRERYFGSSKLTWG